MDRYLTPFVKKDLDKKLVLLSGPRQSGKTTLSQSLHPHSSVYLNFDRTRDRKVIRDESWSREKDLIVFDELHKMRMWKRWIKGTYDTEKIPPRLLVTGSARMDVYRKGGDSLAGRHFLYRLHPVSVAEAVRGGVGMDHRTAYERLLKVGGFPEPFLGDENDAERWRRGHLDRILREDLLDLEKVRDLKSIEILVDLLAERVGSPVSYLSLARDLEISPKTVKHWVEILERMYVVFVVPPYSKNIARAILKEPKIFFYDTGRVVDHPGARLENLVATALLKRNHFLEDTRGERRMLHYVRDQQKREVDFLTLKNGVPEFLIEVKSSKDDPAPALTYFAEKLPAVRALQLVGGLNRDLQYGKVKVRDCSSWLAELEA
jgi:uncharacterized protein